MHQKLTLLTDAMFSHVLDHELHNTCQYTVPLNYNFISTHVYTHGSQRLFVCKMLKFLMFIIIYMRQGGNLKFIVLLEGDS